MFEGRSKFLYNKTQGNTQDILVLYTVVGSGFRSFLPLLSIFKKREKRLVLSKNLIMLHFGKNLTGKYLTCLELIKAFYEKLIAEFHYNYFRTYDLEV